MTGVNSQACDPVKIGIVSISDRASSGVYVDKGLPALQEWLSRALKNPLQFEPRLIADEQVSISATLIELVDAGRDFLITAQSALEELRHGVRRLNALHQGERREACQRQDEIAAPHHQSSRTASTASWRIA